MDAAVSLIKGMDADLVVLPGHFNTGYQFTSWEESLALAEAVPDGETTQALIKLAKEKRISIVAGLAECEKESVITRPYWLARKALSAAIESCTSFIMKSFGLRRVTARWRSIPSAR